MNNNGRNIAAAKLATRLSYYYDFLVRNYMAVVMCYSYHHGYIGCI